MNTQATTRFAAALASVAITFSLISGIATMAKPAQGDAMFAKAATTVALR